MSAEDQEKTSKAQGVIVFETSGVGEIHDALSVLQAQAQPDLSALPPEHREVFRRILAAILSAARYRTNDKSPQRSHSAALQAALAELIPPEQFAEMQGLGDLARQVQESTDMISQSGKMLSHVRESAEQGVIAELAKLVYGNILRVLQARNIFHRLATQMQQEPLSAAETDVARQSFETLNLDGEDPVLLAAAAKQSGRYAEATAVMGKNAETAFLRSIVSEINAALSGVQLQARKSVGKVDNVGILVFQPRTERDGRYHGDYNLFVAKDHELFFSSYGAADNTSQEPQITICNIVDAVVQKYGFKIARDKTFIQSDGAKFVLETIEESK